MHPRRIMRDLSMATAACALVVAGARAQEVLRDPAQVLELAPDAAPEDPEIRRERLEQLRQELQGVYEQLFELQVSYQSAGDDPDVLDSLAVEREVLREHIAELSKRIAEVNASRPELVPVPRRRGDADVYILLEELGQLDTGLDPEEIGRIFESREGIGEVLTILGQQLKDMEIDISSDRVQIDTGSGGRVSFTVPEELRQELSAGMREIGREIHRAFPDSQAGARNWADLIDKLPERIAQGWPDRRGERRKVIAESAFSMGSDFEVADDEIVQGDVLLIGADAYVSGEVQGNVYVLFGDILVEERGLVAKDAMSVGGRVLVDNEAEILGRRFDFGDMGQFTGGSGLSPATRGALFAGRLVVFFALLLLVYALFSERMESMVQHGAAQPARTMIAGVIWFTAVFGLFVIASIGLIVSVIGIPVVLVLSLAMGLVSAMAYLAGCELVGRRLGLLFRPHSEVRGGWKAAALGLALFELPAIAVLVVSSSDVDGLVSRPLTGLEYVLRFLALALGFGAAVQTRIGRRRAQAPPADAGTDMGSAGA